MSCRRWIKKALGLDVMEQYEASEAQLERSAETLRRRADELGDSLTDLRRADIQLAKDLNQLGQPVKYGRRKDDR